MNITPKSEEQIARESLLEPGVYDFEVMDAEDKVSRKGHDMIELSMKVFRPDSGFIYVKDWLLEQMAFKLRHFFNTCNALSLYESGKFTASDCKGMCGKVRLIIQEQEGYNPKNAVKDYVVPKLGLGEGAPEAAKPPARPTVVVGATDDDIPF